MAAPMTFKNFALTRLRTPAFQMVEPAAALEPAAATPMFNASAVMLDAAVLQRATPEFAMVDAASKLEFATVEHARIDVHRLEPLILLPQHIPESPGYERATATRPIVDAVTPADTMIFTDAAGSCYLPRYRLELLSGDEYNISVREASEGGYRLVLGLERYAAPETEHVAGARELPHALSMSIEYETAQPGIYRTLIPDDLVLNEDRTAVIGAARRLTPEERNSFLSALMQRGMRLKFVRAIQVSAQLPDAAAAATPTQLFTAEAVRPQLVQSMRADRRMWTKSMRRFDTASVTPADGWLSDAPPSPPPAVPRYHDLDTALEQPADPEPLVLPASLHPYLYQGGPRPTAGGKLELKQVPYRDETGERFHDYFQDGEDRTLFYYLPDILRLSRAPEEPFYPEMIVRMESEDGSLAKAQAIIDYGMRGFTLPGRLAAAVSELAKSIPVSHGVADGGTPPPAPRLEPLPGAIKLRLRLPSAAGVEMRVFEDATGGLGTGISHTFSVPLREFRQLFAAAFSTDATSLFTGEATVSVGGENCGAVPVDIRFNQTEGPLFDAAETPEPSGAVAVALRNAIESPLRIRELPMVILRGDSQAEATPEGLDLAQPIELAPGASLSFRATPVTTLPGDGPGDVIFDFAEVDILATPDLLLPIVSDTSVPAEYDRAIEIMSLAELFDAEHPDGPIILINVEFESGDPVRITKDALSVAAVVKLPLVNMLLGRDNKGAYRFRQQVIRRSGAQTSDSDWRSADFGVLVVPVSG